MNFKPLLILFVIAGLSSCTTAYKIGQTPDDVYYSPAPPQNEYVTTRNEEERNDYYTSSSEDREIRRRINNRRLRVYNDYDYGYNYPTSYPSVYISPYGYNSYPYGYNSYGYNYYSPYSYNYYPVYVYPKTRLAPTYVGPRKYNLGTYTPTSTLSTNTRSGNINTGARGNAPVRTFTKPPANNGSGVGNFIRKVFSPTNNSGSSNRSNDNSTQSRSFEPSRSSSNSSSSSSSRSSGGGGSAPVRSFNK